jgi:CHAT domain-containing protein
LPFATLDGLFIAGINDARIGSDVTVHAIQESLSKHGIVLLSSHGYFDSGDAWKSSIMTSDGSIKISELLLNQLKIHADLVVLGVCEGGRSNISYSDEPIGFPGILIKAGVPAIVAPMWMVDDFATHLFLSMFFQFVLKGIHPGSALHKASSWLRELKASEVLDIIASLELKLDNQINIATATDVKHLKYRLSEIKLALQKEPVSSRPFMPSFYWAAFQISGYIP